jgi:DNA replication protein DnaC
MIGLFPDYADKNLEDFQIQDPSHEMALRTVEKYIADLRGMHRRGHGLTFLGNVGVGKTMLAEMVLKAAQATPYQSSILRSQWAEPDEEPIIVEKKYFVESIRADAFIQLHQDLMDISKKDEYDGYQELRKQIRRLGTMHFVLFDDVGREHVGGSGWSNHLLFNVLRSRSDQRLPFLVTSNLNLTELAERYDEGFTSLLHEKTDIIGIQGGDFRCNEDS